MEVVIDIRCEPDVARAIARANAISESVRFTAVDRSRIATAVSELARNILKYAGHGQLTLRPITDRPVHGMEVVALDHGPGIDDVHVALRDHHSTGGTLGLGLPGVRRLMDEFDLESKPGAGTRVTVRKWL